MKILITGANGFIGTALLNESLKRAFSIKAAVRTIRSIEVRGIEYHSIGDISKKVEWESILDECDVVVHTAARVHMMRERQEEFLDAYRKVNVDATINLANQSEKCGIRRFIYLSSIKVNGKPSCSRPFTAKDEPNPQDSYGVSKLEAELALSRIAGHGRMDVVVIRPPLVYGPGVKANFLQMMKWIDYGLPLPFGKFENKRSMVGIDNLVDLILKCVVEPREISGTYLVSDGIDVSFPELLRDIGKALGKPARLFNFSPKVLAAGLKMIGKNDLYDRLCESLQVDISDTRKMLYWDPPLSLEAGLEKTVKHYLSNKQNRHCADE
jgi:UDP-glucose 4-epimerase